MADYISRETAVAIFRAKADMGVLTPAQTYFNRAADMIALLPAADVEPVRRGAWYPCFEDWRQQQEGNKCSVCGFEYYGTGIRAFHYCPNCGAKMDFEGENHDN